jgi:hypothetical protein
MLRGLHLAIIQTAALLVPAPERAEWLAEWRAELWYVNRRATAFCLGSIRDAFWINRNTPAPLARCWFNLESPVKCLMFLAGLTALSVLLAFVMPGEPGTGFRQDGYQDLPLACFGGGLELLVILLSVRPLRLGEYPVNRYAPAAPLRLLRWFFLAVKLAFVVSVALCGLLALALTAPPLASMMFLGLFLGFRWALMDQRERCPVCLRLLSNPTRVGDPSQSFLGWYGTELSCSHGHGFLFVPGASTSWYETQRWQYLDPTWNTLLP